MEVFAGSAKESDVVFMALTSLVDDHLKNDNISSEGPFLFSLMDETLMTPKASNRHLALQLALIFCSGVGQLSPGAYLLRKNLYPSIVCVSLSPSLAHGTFNVTLVYEITKHREVHIRSRVTTCDSCKFSSV